MEAIRLQKKYPEVSRDEMFDLVNRFKSVVCIVALASLSKLTLEMKLDHDRFSRACRQICGFVSTTIQRAVLRRCA